MQKNNKFKKWFTFIVLVIAGSSIYKLPSLKDAFYVPMQEFFNLTHTQIGNALSLWSITATAGFFAAIYTADRFPKKIALPVSLIATGLMGIYLSTFPGYHSILFIWAMFGVTCDMGFWPILLKSIKSLGTKEEQGRLFGFLEAGRGIVDTVIASTALVIFAFMGKGAGGLRAAILFLSLLVIIVGIIAYFCLENDPAEEKKEDSPFSGVMTAIKTKEIWVAAFTIFSVYSIYCGLTYFIPFLKDVYALPVTLVGAYGIINQYVLKMIGGPLGGFAADKKFKSPSKYLRFTFILSFLVMAVIIMLPHESMNVYLGMTATLGFGTIIFTQRAIFFAPMGELNIPEKISGSAMAIGSFVGYAPAMYCYSVFGKILDTYPGLTGYRIVFCIMAFFALAGFFISNYLVILINRKQPA